jgi:hypothetical protein
VRFTSVGPDFAHGHYTRLILPPRQAGTPKIDFERRGMGHGTMPSVTERTKFAP